MLMLILLTAGMILTASAEVYSGTWGAEEDGSNLTWTLDAETGELTISGSGKMASLGLSSTDAWLNYTTEIKTVTIGDGVTSIGDSAFRDCDSLTSIEIPSSVTSIGDSAFRDCDSLTSIELPSSMISIGNRAFSNCTGLTSIEIPSGVISIGDDAFSNCHSLTSINVDVNNTEYCSLSGVLYNKAMTDLIHYPVGTNYH